MVESFENLSKVPPVDKPERAVALMAVFALPVAAGVTNLMVGFGETLASIVAILAGLALIATQIPRFLNHGIEPRPLRLGSEHMDVPFPLTYHASPNGRTVFVGWNKVIDRSLFFNPIFLTEWKLTAVWSGDGDSRRARVDVGASGSGDTAENMIHQVDLSKDSKMLRLCKCADPDSRLLPLVERMNERGRSRGTVAVGGADLSGRTW